MYCSKCGRQVPDGTKICPSCGENLSEAGKVADAANNMFNQAEREMDSALNEVKQSVNGTGGQRLKDDRGIVSYIILTIITCGIYGYYFLYKIAHDANIACDGDGENTSGLVAFVVLSFLTCGIYAYYWYYKLGNRLAMNAPRYGMNFQENGTTILLWIILGSFLCGIGPLIAMNILINNSNKIFNAYNRAHNL